MRRRHLESVSAALYGSTFQHLLKSPIRIQPQLSGKGVLGHSPKCVLPTFAHTKVGPRRAGVQAVTLRRLRYADRRPQTIPCRVGIQILISKRPRPAARRLPTWSRISSAAHSSANRSPCRLAVPEKIFALLACSIFSTATDAPPRCIRHWRRSAPHPAHRDPFPGPGLLGYPSYLLHRSVSSAVTSGRWAFRSHICKSGAICARQPAAARPGRLYISRSAGFASSSASVSSRAV